MIFVVKLTTIASCFTAPINVLLGLHFVHVLSTTVDVEREGGKKKEGRN